MIVLFDYYPYVYVDTGVIDWLIPRKEFYAYLCRLVEAGYGKRIMFGSDNMAGPESIRLAVKSIESAERPLSPHTALLSFGNVLI